MKGNSPPRVVLIHDHNLMRAGLKSLLERQLAQVVGEAPTAAEGLIVCLSTPHDILVLDLHLPGQNGLWLLERLIEAGWNGKTLVVSTQAHQQSVLSALRAGAHGDLTKTAEPSEFYAAFQEILAGGHYVEPRPLAGRLLRDRPKDPPSVTPREREILNLVAQGFGNNKIAETLHLTEATVKTHLHNLFRKLEVGTRLEAVAAGLNYGLVIHSQENFG